MPTPPTRRARPNTEPITLINPGTTAVTYTEDGRSLGGGESAAITAPLDQVALLALERGYLLGRRGDAPVMALDGVLIESHPNDEPGSPGASNIDASSTEG